MLSLRSLETVGTSGRDSGSDSDVDDEGDLRRRLWRKTRRGAGASGTAPLMIESELSQRQPPAPRSVSSTTVSIERIISTRGVSSFESGWRRVSRGFVTMERLFRRAAAVDRSLHTLEDPIYLGTFVYRMCLKRIP